MVVGVSCALVSLGRDAMLCDMTVYKVCTLCVSLYADADV